MGSDRRSEKSRTGCERRGADEVERSRSVIPPSHSTTPTPDRNGSDHVHSGVRHGAEHGVRQRSLAHVRGLYDSLAVAGRTSVIERIRKICLALPEVTERPSHGAPTFFVKKSFLTVWANGHHDHTFPHLWCAAPPGTQELLIADDPAHIFRPPYVGHRGWIGVRLDDKVDWAQIEDLCEDAYRTVAPARLVAELDGTS
jgi:hypothetical protein